MTSARTPIASSDRRTIEPGSESWARATAAGSSRYSGVALNSFWATANAGLTLPT
jgi:hypothetical protein